MAVMREEMERYRLQLIAEGEREHLERLRQFPYRVRLAFNDNLDANCERMVSIERLLLDRLADEDFVAFPGTSIGQHKEDIFCVFFRRIEDAIIMKLTL